MSAMPEERLYEGLEKFQNEMANKSDAELQQAISNMTAEELQLIRLAIRQKAADLAHGCARIAHDHLYQHHWGVTHLDEDSEDLVFYDNHAHPTMREHIVKRLRDFIEAVGGKEIASATYTPEPNCGETLAIIFTGVDRDDLNEVLAEAIRESMALVRETDATSLTGRAGT